MLGYLAELLVFPAPEPSYTAACMKGALIWLPWVHDGNRQQAQAGSLPAGGLPCLWVPYARTSSVVLYFHANAEDLGMVFGAMKQLSRELRVSVLAIEYPGYGLLKDLSPSEQGIYDAAEAALTYLRSVVGVQSSQVMLLGRSLGSAPAIHLAGRHPVACLVLVNAFCSVWEVAEARVGKALAWLTFGSAFQNTAHICNVRCPLLVVHGAHDVTVPPAHSERLVGLARGAAQKSMATPDGMNHNSGLFESPSFLLLPMAQLLKLRRSGEVPQLPPEVWLPKQAAPRHETGCAARCAAPRLCNSSCPAFGDLEACSFTVPSSAATLGDVHLEDIDSSVYAAKGSDRGPAAPPLRRAGGVA